MSGAIKVAFAGAPNTGKSTLFNALTGLKQHTGNWPGKTVEQKVGRYRRNGTRFSLIDLPGSYSLSANSLEEQTSRDFLAIERPDVVVAVVDASTLERNLYLVRELLELGLPLVVALNMMDVATRIGSHIDVALLEAVLGVPVVPLVARKSEGLSRLIDAIEHLARKTSMESGDPLSMGSALEQRIDALDYALPAELALPYPRRWLLTKLLEGDPAVVVAVKAAVSAADWQLIEPQLRDRDATALTIAGARYDWAAAIYRQVVRREKRSASWSERADHVFLHPIGGLLFFMTLIFGVYWLMFSAAAPLQRWLNDLVVDGGSRLETALDGWPDWSVSLLSDGVIGGAGLVLTFIPVLAILFLMLAILEDVGYMARAAFVMDRFMHRIGLRGKSFLPLFIGWGCNVPAITGSRIIESRSARLTTALVAPLVPCSARMVVIALFTATFFGSAAVFVSWGMVMVNLAVLAVMSLLISRFLFRGQQSSFVMELPHYHMPSVRGVLLATWERLRRFVTLAGTVILAMSLIVWFLSTFPGDGVEDSFLGHIGRWLEPVGGLMGLDWRMVIALLTSFVAKEQTIATLGVIMGTGGDSALKTNLSEIMTPAAAVAFIVLQMLFVPCVASVAALRQETGSWRWVAFAVGYMLAISLIGATAVYQGARLLGWGV